MLPVKDILFFSEVCNIILALRPYDNEKMDDKIIVKDSNGNVLAEGDSVLLTKDLKVKGFNKDLKRGTLIKNIRLTDNPGEIEGKVEGSVLVVKTMFLKKK